MGGPPQTAPAAPPPQAVVGATDGQVFIVTSEGLRRLHAREALRSPSTVRTSLLGRARIELPDGARVYLGPGSILNLLPDALSSMLDAGPAWATLLPGPTGGTTTTRAPLELAAGEAVVENRPGRPGAPALSIAAPMLTVRLRGDSRAALRVTVPTDVTRATVRVMAMRGRLDLLGTGGALTPGALTAGQQATGASVLGTARWTLGKADPAQIDQTWWNVFPGESRQLVEGRPTIVDWDSLTVCGREALGPARVLTQSQLEDGELVFQGRIVSTHMPGPPGLFHVEVTSDAWASTERVEGVDPHGAWGYSLAPQDGQSYELAAQVVETGSGRVIERTPTIPVRYVEEPHLTIDRVSVGSIVLGDLPVLHLGLDDLVASRIAITAEIPGVAPAEGLAAVVSGDAGLHWREAAIRAMPQGDLWEVSSFLEPVPGASYRIVLRILDLTGATEGRPILTWQSPGPLVYHEETAAQRVGGLLLDIVSRVERGDFDRARASIAPQFSWESRDLARLSGLRLTPGTARREGSLCKLAATWTRAGGHGGESTGEAVFVFARTGDWQLLDVFGDDPLAPPPLLLRPREGAADEAVATGPGEELPMRKISLIAGQTYDFLEERPGSYDAAHLPRDVAFVLEQGAPSLVTHDRRLVDLGPEPALSLRSLERPVVEWSSRIRPEPGHTYYVRTLGHRGVLLQVDDLSVAASAPVPTLQLSYAPLRADAGEPTQR